jgi:glucose repression regulatory protein TUP1
MAVETQEKELQDLRRNVNCEGCRKRSTGAPQVVPSSRLKAKKPTRSLTLRLRNFVKPSTSGPLRGVVSSRQTRRSTQRPTDIQEHEAHSAIIPTSQSSDLAITHPEFVSLPSTSKPSASTADSDSESEERGWSISYNNDVGKELDVEIVKTLSHEESIRCVKFSLDGKYLAAGCDNGKAYIYDVSGKGTLSW